MAIIKTTHVGSLPRPQEMIAKTLRKQAISESDMRQYLTDIVEKQMSLGISYISNGELPRPDYVRATVDRISGFGAAGTAPLPQDLEELPELSRRFGGRNGLITLNPKVPVQLPACSEPLVYKGQASLRQELDMLVAVHKVSRDRYPETQSELFFTSPSPGTVALFMEDQYYFDDERYLEAISSVLRREYELISSSGVHLQVDCPDLAMGRHTRYKQLSDEAFLNRVRLNISALNQALSSVDADQCRVHICWGNYPGTHHADIELRKIFQQVMRVDARYISLEASNHRHAHEWALFEEFEFPADKVLMPGVIDTGSNTVEHPNWVSLQIANFAGILGPDRVIASTDCGFATTASATSVSGDVAWLKLASLVKGARQAAELF